MVDQINTWMPEEILIPFLPESFRSKWLLLASPSSPMQMNCHTSLELAFVLSRQWDRPSSTLSKTSSKYLLGALKCLLGALKMHQNTLKCLLGALKMHQSALKCLLVGLKMH